MQKKVITCILTKAQKKPTTSKHRHLVYRVFDDTSYTSHTYFDYKIMLNCAHDRNIVTKEH